MPKSPWMWSPTLTQTNTWIPIILPVRLWVPDWYLNISPKATLSGSFSRITVPHLQFLKAPWPGPLQRSTSCPGPCRCGRSGPLPALCHLLPAGIKSSPAHTQNLERSPLRDISLFQAFFSNQRLQPQEAGREASSDLVPFPLSLPTVFPGPQFLYPRDSIRLSLCEHRTLLLLSAVGA